MTKNKVIIKVVFSDVIGKDTRYLEFVRDDKIKHSPYYWQNVVIRYARVMYTKHKLFMRSASVTFTF